MQEPPESEAVIAIVDDDPSVRRGLERLIRSVGWKAETFASAQEFLGRPPAEPPSCLVLDLQLPGLSGLNLQKQMAEGRVGDACVGDACHPKAPPLIECADNNYEKHASTALPARQELKRSGRDFFGKRHGDEGDT